MFFQFQMLLARRPAETLRIAFVLLVAFWFVTGLILLTPTNYDGRVSRSLLGFENNLQVDEHSLPSGINSYKELRPVAYVRQTEREALLKHMNAFRKLSPASQKKFKILNDERLRKLHEPEKATTMADKTAHNSKEEHGSFEPHQHEAEAEQQGLLHQTAIVFPKSYTNMTKEQQSSVSSSSVNEQSLDAFRKMIISSDPQAQLLEADKQRLLAELMKHQQGVEGLLKLEGVKVEQQEDGNPAKTTTENSPPAAAETEGKKDNLDHDQDLRRRQV